MQEFIPPWKCGGEFPERVALDVPQRDMEVDELRLVSRCRDRDVTLADDLREIGVVAGVGAEKQPQAGVLVGVHRRATDADAHAHHALVRKEAIQIQFQLFAFG